MFVVLRDGDKDVARQRIVQPGMTYGDMVSITQGLSSGDRVISNRRDSGKRRAGCAGNSLDLQAPKRPTNGTP